MTIPAYIWPRDLLIKPFLKWAGGKTQLLPILKRYLPDDIYDLRYFEPFVGAGALFFELQPARGVVCDNNKELMLTYLAVKEQVEELINLLKVHRERNDEEYYYQVRNQDRDTTAFARLTDLEKAARLIYLNKTCFNGLYRVNSSGFFNVPFGRYKNPSIFDASILRAIHRYLNRPGTEIEILCVDYAETVANAGRDSFIYFDPPYHKVGKKSFTSYQAGGFDEREQERLRDVFVQRTAAGAKCLLSNADTPFVRELYEDKGFEIIELRAKRNINSDGAKRGEVGEVLIKNW